MSSKEDERRPTVDRRAFLKGAATGAATIAVATPAANAQSATGASAARHSAPAPAPSPEQLARDAGSAVPPPLPAHTTKRPGSDLMVQTLKELGVEFVAANPGSSFEGLQESLVNYGDPPNSMPELISALHEETAVDMADGYGKAEGRPMCAMLHGAIGLQHGSMAIYQSFYAGTPLLLIAGRDDGFIQAQTANDMGAIVRSFTKWDAQPRTLPECLDALQEAYRQAITPPTGPTLVIIDTELQKQEAGTLSVPKYRPPTIEGVDAATAHEIAQRLLGATNPHINVGQLRTPEGVRNAVELSELVGASTSTRATSGPMSFPQRHPLCGPGSSTQYDFTLGLETGPASLAIMGPRIASLAPTRDKTGIGFGGLRGAAATPATAPGAPEPIIDRRIAADAEASLPEIIRAARGLMTPARQRTIAARTAKHAAANREATLTALRKAVDAKRIGWDASPVSTARIYAELWPLIMNEDWCLASPSAFSGSHHRELWAHNRPYSYLGQQGAGGMGYGAGACGGAALAARRRNRFVINVQTDGDLNYQPGVLWTAVHHRLPMLTIMHNNRAWHAELMFLEFMAGVRGRGTDRASIGTTLRDPFIDYRKMAEAYGMAGEGPIENPSLLAAAFRRGIDSVKRGEPYMIDVVTQPR
ncbi:MAG TPA: thiamine pyrophosphate-dependent enzyme [Steroidobacteraceae bacterium]|nr:thiamine pyrophosphate-dependent enzyme [Steroidobacteraceae bacterium]